MTPREDLVLTGRQPLTGGDPHLPLNEVPAGDHLGNRMLDLKPGVHFHEEELVRTVAGNDELHGARADVVDAAGGVAGRRADAGAGGGVEQRRGSLLDDLLMTALQTALPLTEMENLAMRVGEHLNLDMPGRQHKPLEKKGVVAEGRAGLAARSGECGR